MATESWLSSKAELLTKAVALFLVVAYGAGFVVVSEYNATFGIVDFDLLQSRILAAGVWFIIFVALTLLAVDFICQRFGFARSRVQADLRETETAAVRSFREIQTMLFGPWYQLLSLLCFCIFLAFASASVSEVHLTMADLILTLAGALLLAPHGLRAVLALLHPFTALKLYGVSGISRLHFLGIMASCFFALAICTVIFSGRTFLMRTGWFFALAIFIWSLYPDQGFMRTQFPWLLTCSLGFVILFSRFIFPYVQPQLGGGWPQPAVFQFVDKSPLPNGRLWLIDETEGGYYVLRQPREKKAVFLPRNQVRAIFFGGAEEAGQKLPMK